MVGKMASGEFRARVFGARYVVSFMSLALSLPLIGMVHQRWGFDVLFWLLAACAAIVLCAAAMGLSDVLVIANALRLRSWRRD